MNLQRNGENPVFYRVAIIVSSIADRPIQQINRGTRWNELGIHQETFTQIILACEREFGISIPEADADAALTPGELASAIFLKLQRAA